MSLLKDVLASIKPNKTCSRDDTLIHMEEMIIQSEKNRDNVYSSLESRYLTLSEAFHDSSKLQEMLDNCLKSMTNVDNKIQEEILGNIESSVGEVGRVSRKWKEVTGELEVAQHFLDIHNLMEKADEARFDKRYSVSAECLNSIEDILKDISLNAIEQQLDITSALKDKFIIKKNELIYNVGEVWMNTIVWNEEEQVDGSKSVSLSITPLTSSSLDFDTLQEIVLTLVSTGELQRKMHLFGKSLLEHLISPIVQEKADLELSVNSNLVVFNVVSSNKDHRTAVDALRTIQEMFEILNKVLLHVLVKADDPNSSLISMLGRQIGDDFTKLILKDCLAEAVPCNKEDLKDFDDVTVQAEELQKYLVSVGFYTPDQKSLLDYAANVEIVFSNKACANLLSKARNLMLKPLHVTATIGPLTPDGPLVAVNESGETLQSTANQLEKLLSAQSFNLPQCQVSISVCDLVDLIYETLEEACHSSAEYAGRLFYTVRNILSLYCHVVPTAHLQTLSTIPQSAALVHNNSFFLAHHALLLGQQYSSRLPGALKNSSLTAIDIAQLIRTCGSDVFLKAMQIHKASLLDTLREGTGMPSLGCEISAVRSAESCVKQCLHQFERLHSVWQNVLPHSVYTKAIGVLISSVVEDFVLKISGLQDISADSALALSTVFCLLKDKIPSFFKVKGQPKTSENDVVREVRLWNKMCELIIVLGANLKEINDRWADGKGPLAHNFTAEESKQLIRALFQNTDRRAQVLASIM